MKRLAHQLNSEYRKWSYSPSYDIPARKKENTSSGRSEKLSQFRPNYVRYDVTQISSHTQFKG